MSMMTTILGTLVAIEFFYIFYLETVATRRSSNFDINLIILLKTNKHESPK